jgi:ribosomal protein S18 acetylase RimI-like enzyme
VKLDVRRARAEDFRRIHELRDIFVAYLQKLCPAYADAPEDWISAGDFKKSLNSRRHLWLVGESAGQTIAYVHSSIQDDDDGYKVDPYAEIVGIVVDPAFRRRGVGRSLLKAVETWVSQRGLSSLRLVVHDANVAAIRLYEQLGYGCYMRMLEKRRSKKTARR